jgi:hypothetical protein
MAVSRVRCSLHGLINFCSCVNCVFLVNSGHVRRGIMYLHCLADGTSEAVPWLPWLFHFHALTRFLPLTRAALRRVCILSVLVSCGVRCCSLWQCCSRTRDDIGCKSEMVSQTFSGVALCRYLARRSAGEAVFSNHGMHPPLSLLLLRHVASLLLDGRGICLRIQSVRNRALACAFLLSSSLDAGIGLNAFLVWCCGAAGSAAKSLWKPLAASLGICQRYARPCGPRYRDCAVRSSRLAR